MRQTLYPINELHTNNIISGTRRRIYPRPGKRSAAGQDTADTIPAFVPDGGINALSGLRHPPVSLYCAGPASAARRRAMTTGPVLLFMPGGGSHALPGIRFVRPAVNLFTIVAETAGVAASKIAETFPEGRGSPHGCGAEAVFCTDAASPDPKPAGISRRDRVAVICWPEPGVQGAAATGRPCALPAPCRT